MQKTTHLEEFLYAINGMTQPLDLLRSFLTWASVHPASTALNELTTTEIMSHAIADGRRSMSNRETLDVISS
jgi:hypothetical protein